MITPDPPERPGLTSPSQRPRRNHICKVPAALRGHVFKDPGIGMGVSCGAAVLFPWEQFPKSEDGGAPSGTGTARGEVLRESRGCPGTTCGKGIRERPRKLKTVHVRMKVRTLNTYIRLYYFALFFLIITTTHSGTYLYYPN